MSAWTHGAPRASAVGDPDDHARRGRDRPRRVHDLGRRRAREHAPADAAHVRGARADRAAALAEGHAPVLPGGRRAAAAHPGDDGRARPEPRRRRARARPRGGDRADARAHRGARDCRRCRRRCAWPRSSRRCAARSAPSSCPTAAATSSWCAPPTPARRSRHSRTASPGPEEQMQPDRFTIKSQEALAGAARLAQERANPQVAARRTCCPCCSATATAHRRSTRPAGSFPACWRSSASTPRALRRPDRRRRSRSCRPSRAGVPGEGTQPSAELTERAAQPPSRRPGSWATSTSPPSTCCSRSPRSRARPARRCAPTAPTASGVLRALTEVRGANRVTDQSPEEKYEALERYGRDLTESPSRASSTR